MSDVLDAKELHDDLLKHKPEDAPHEEASCPFCNDNTSVGGGDTMTEIKTYTEEELSAAVMAAVTPVKEAAEAKVEELTSEIDSLRAAKETEETEDAVSAVKAEADLAEARAVAAEEKLAETLSWLEEQAQLAEISQYLEDLKTERLAVIEDVASFSEDYVSANVDRWVAWSDSDFAAFVEDLKAIKSADSASKSEKDSGKTKSETAMSNTRSSEHDAKADAAVVYSGIRRGVDIRRL